MCCIQMSSELTQSKFGRSFLSFLSSEDMHEQLCEGTTACLAVKIRTVKVPKQVPERVERDTEEREPKRGFVSVVEKIFGFQKKPT